MKRRAAALAVTIVALLAMLGPTHAASLEDLLKNGYEIKAAYTQAGNQAVFVLQWKTSVYLCARGESACTKLN